MTDRELMQMALNCLTAFGEDIKSMTPDEYEVIAALRARLAQTEPEPVAFIDKRFGELLTPSQDNAWVRWKMKNKLPSDDVPEPLYAASPQREFIELTNEEIELECETAQVMSELSGDMWPIMLCLAIQDKLREKNSG